MAVSSHSFVKVDKYPRQNPGGDYYEENLWRALGI